MLVCVRVGSRCAHLCVGPVYVHTVCGGASDVRLHNACFPCIAHVDDRALAALHWLETHATPARQQHEEASHVIAGSEAQRSFDLWIQRSPCMYQRGTCCVRVSPCELKGVQCVSWVPDGMHVQNGAHLSTVKSASYTFTSPLHSGGAWPTRVRSLNETCSARISTHIPA